MRVLDGLGLRFGARRFFGCGERKFKTRSRSSGSSCLSAAAGVLGGACMVLVCFLLALA